MVEHDQGYVDIIRIPAAIKIFRMRFASRKTPIDIQLGNATSFQIFRYPFQPGK